MTATIMMSAHIILVSACYPPKTSLDVFCPVIPAPNSFCPSTNGLMLCFAARAMSRMRKFAPCLCLLSMSLPHTFCSHHALLGTYFPAFLLLSTICHTLLSSFCAWLTYFRCDLCSVHFKKCKKSLFESVDGIRSQCSTKRISGRNG